ncbi:MAG: chromate efflux transporter [Cyclobacteriaceae bacterium]
MTVKRIRYLIFLRDVLILSVTAFGGPQVHFALFIRVLVNKRGYLKEEELIELNALCNFLPGPTSTQTITALGFKLGGPSLAYLTLLVWIFPAFVVMTSFALLISHFQSAEISIAFTRFIQPMAVGFISYAAVIITRKVVKTFEGAGVMVIAAIACYMLKSPFVFPVIMILSASVTAIKFKTQPVEEKNGFKIDWSNFILWAVVFIVAALLGHFTKALPFRVFENFYRNGSMIFGGGQVLIPLLYTEFVEFKRYLTSEEFLTGYAAVQAVPGPVFSFASYIGALSMRQYGDFGEILGSMMATAGIFLPGTFFIFFVIRFWEELKKYRVIRASLEGISAASAGMVVAAAFLMFDPIDVTALNMIMILGSFILLIFTRIPPPFIILAGLIAGLLL